MRQREAVRQAVLTPERFVMKPQLEGGGHNFYGASALRVCARVVVACALARLQA